MNSYENNSDDYYNFMRILIGFAIFYTHNVQKNCYLDQNKKMV